MSNNTDDVLVQTLETVATAVWGELTRLKIYTPDYRQLSWLEVWQAFAAIYPGRWALELYPPADEMVNDAHVYHLLAAARGGRPTPPLKSGEQISLTRSPTPFFISTFFQPVTVTGLFLFWRNPHVFSHL